MTYTCKSKKTSTGKPCKCPVKKPGDKCHRHQRRPKCQQLPSQKISGGGAKQKLTKTEKCDRFCQQRTEKNRKGMDKFLTQFGDDSMIRGHQIIKANNSDFQDCKKDYCNPGCKGTLFEKGPAEQVPKVLLKWPDFLNRNHNNYKLKRRKEIFGSRKNVLKNGFYHKLDHKSVEKIRKMGALSGCFDHPSYLRENLWQ